MDEDRHTEQLFKAIDAIIVNRLQGLAYDRYVIATVVDITNASVGKYIVTTDNNITFDAYSDRTDLFEGIQVYVRIPQGDYTKRKVITELYEPYIVQQNNKIKGIKQETEKYTNTFLIKYRQNFLIMQNLIKEKEIALKNLQIAYQNEEITLEQFNQQKANIENEFQQNSVDLQKIIDDYIFEKIKLQEKNGVILDNPYDIIKKNNLIL